MIRILIALFLSISGVMFSQKVSGIVMDEEGNPLAATLVINVTTGERTSSNTKGEFSINASPNNELRLVRKSYERKSKIVVELDFVVTFKVTLVKLAQEIEEVEIKQKLSGDLKTDNKYFGPPKDEVILNSQIRQYRRQKSDASVMQAKRNEFVQPKGQGFETVKIGFKWTDFDFFLYLNRSLGDDYFYSLGLTKPQIQSFIFFALIDFEKREILRFGYCSPANLAKFQVHAEKKIVMFKNKR